MESGNQNSVDELNHLLKTEWSAIKVYKRAVSSAPDQYIKQELISARQSHKKRAEILEARVYELGGEPDHGSSHFDTIGQIIETVSSTVGEKVAILALEEEEIRSVQDYLRRLPNLDEKSRQLVVQTLLPEQKKTKSLLTALRKRTAC